MSDIEDLCHKAGKVLMFKFIPLTMSDAKDVMPYSRESINV